MTSFTGLADLTAAQRDKLFDAFGVSRAAAAAYNKQHPSPKAPSRAQNGVSAGQQPLDAVQQQQGEVGSRMSARQQRKKEQTQQQQQDSGDKENNSPKQTSSKRQQQKGLQQEEDPEPDLEAPVLEDDAVLPPPKRQRQSKGSVLPQPPGAAEMSEYERQRQEQIARNRARLAALQLPELAAEVEELFATKQNRQVATQRGVHTANKRKARDDAGEAVRRHSLRVRGLGPDGLTSAGIATENADGSVTLVAGAVTAEGKPRHPQGVL